MTIFQNDYSEVFILFDCLPGFKSDFLNVAIQDKNILEFSVCFQKKAEKCFWKYRGNITEIARKSNCGQDFEKSLTGIWQTVSKVSICLGFLKSLWQKQNLMQRSSSPQNSRFDSDIHLHCLQGEKPCPKLHAKSPTNMTFEKCDYHRRRWEMRLTDFDFVYGTRLCIFVSPVCKAGSNESENIWITYRVVCRFCQNRA